MALKRLSKARIDLQTASSQNDGPKGAAVRFTRLVLSSSLQIWTRMGSRGAAAVSGAVTDSRNPQMLAAIWRRCLMVESNQLVGASPGRAFFCRLFDETVDETSSSLPGQQGPYLTSLDFKGFLWDFVGSHTTRCFFVIPAILSYHLASVPRIS